MPNDDAENASLQSYSAADEPSGDPNQGTESEEASSCCPLPYRLPLRGLVIAGSLAGLVVALAQWFAPTFDYQNANMITMAVCLLFSLFCLFVFHRLAKSRGRRFLVPAISICAIALFGTLFRHEGFSGEMLPQFSWRFQSDSRGDWQDAPVANAEADFGGRAADSDVLPPSADDDPVAIASEAFAQFLGPNRNGVIPTRQFSVPTTNDDVQVLWDQAIGDGWSSFAVDRDRAVTLEQRDENECVVCYRLSDGALLWIDRHETRHENPLGGVGPRSTPAIFGGKVYAMGALGFLRVLDLATGERVWTKDFLQEANWTVDDFLSAAPWGHASSPLVVESLGVVVVGFGGPVDAAALDAEGMTDLPKSLIAMDLDSGEVKWKAGRDQFSYASPMWIETLDGPQIVSVNEKTITGHSSTGETLWSVSWPGSTNTNANCASVIPTGLGKFLVGKGYGGGSAVFQITRDESGGFSADDVWASNRVLQTKFNHTCVKGDVGFGLSNGTLQAVDLRTGKVLWSQSRRDRFGQGQVLLVDDVLVAQTEPGDVVFVAADPLEYRELGRLKGLSSKTWNIPTVAGRHLLVRNDRQAICYWLPSSE